MSLPDEFLLRYPEFKETDVQKVGLFLSDAQAEISRKRWGKFYERGVMALTAHLLKLNFESSESGGQTNRPLSAESAGELSVSYALPPTGLEESYHLTAYGQEYLRLRKLVGIGVMVA